MSVPREPTNTATKLMIFQNYYSMEKNIRNIKPRIEAHNDLQYSHITDGQTSKKSQNRKNRIREIEYENSNLLDKLQTIFHHQNFDNKPVHLKSLNYNRRKREVSRINSENKAFYKVLRDVKSAYKREDYAKWNDNNNRYKRNISTSSRRKDPMRPIITPAIATAYPQLVSKKEARKHWKPRSGSAFDRNLRSFESGELARSLLNYTPVGSEN
ncbi:unnamed protein product [Blepharisma stoltei]|uniref:Uncharacterized protein n=1 Tax=Blepharisma stoltei TaxID=1481888 RepID=A0AAU9IPX2_9CILI|nr:unnamed protein product [Blepharisma stoltei]